MLSTLEFAWHDHPVAGWLPSFAVCVFLNMTVCKCPVPPYGAKLTEHANREYFRRVRLPQAPIACKSGAATPCAQITGAGVGTFLLVALVIYGSMVPILKAAKNEAFGAAPSELAHVSDTSKVRTPLTTRRFTTSDTESANVRAQSAEMWQHRAHNAMP